MTRVTADNRVSSQTSAERRRGRIRFRDSLNKLRCQKPTSLDGEYDESPASREPNVFRSCLRDRIDYDETEAPYGEFSSRYGLTVLHTRRISKVSLSESDKRLLLPSDMRSDEKTGMLFDERYRRFDVKSDVSSHVDTVATDWETVDGGFPRNEEKDATLLYDDNRSWDGDYTVDEDVTLPSASTSGGTRRSYQRKGVVADVVDVFDDFTYFFRCLKVEAQQQLSNSSLQCGG